LITFFKILFATKDVLEDAHNSFLKEAEEDDLEKITQLNELNRAR
jgi:hypothetical protein